MQGFALVEGFTALDNVMIPLDFAERKRRRKRKERRERALKMLELVGMEEYADKQTKNPDNLMASLPPWQTPAR